MRFDPREVLGYDTGDKVRYIGCGDSQISYTGFDDPRPHLEIGIEYEVAYVDVGDWSSEVTLVDFPSLGFTSVCFEEV